VELSRLPLCFNKMIGYFRLCSFAGFFYLFRHAFFFKSFLIFRDILEKKSIEETSRVSISARHANTLNEQAFLGLFCKAQTLQVVIAFK
jgi:hypothetical protein